MYRVYYTHNNITMCVDVANMIVSHAYANALSLVCGKASVKKDDKLIYAAIDGKPDYADLGYEKDFSDV